VTENRKADRWPEGRARGASTQVSIFAVDEFKSLGAGNSGLPKTRKGWRLMYVWADLKGRDRSEG
jgi:hypothetical protein